MSEFVVAAVVVVDIVAVVGMVFVVFVDWVMAAWASVPERVPAWLVCLSFSVLAP